MFLLNLQEFGEVFMKQLSPQTGRVRERKTAHSENFFLAGFCRWELIKPDI